MSFMPSSYSSSAVSERTYLRTVFAWMFLALAITTGVAFYLHSTTSTSAYFQAHHAIFFVLVGVQLISVIGLSAMINRISVQLAAIIFCVYAALTGVTFAVLFDVYTTASIVSAFAGAAGVFAGMAAYGWVTDRDLSRYGGILFGALIGIVLASIVYAFTGGPTFNLILGFLGVIIFSALTAYDMQNIKQIGAQGISDADTEQKLAIFGALRLYLDFINLAISLLRIFGNAR